MKKIILTLSTFISALFLAACQPQTTDTQARQQNFICSALIEGFLKAQNLAHYELHQIQPMPHSAEYQHLYIYKAQIDRNQILLPQQHKLRFACQQISARQFQVQLQDPQQANTPILLSLELPEPLQLKALTAFNSTAAL